MALQLALKSVVSPKTYLPSLDQDFNKGLEQGAKGGDVDLVNFFIERGAIDWNRGNV